ncbi:MAG: flagellar protein FliS [Chitinispirillia bacterium]|nr:flagellar protein FliS [Chitinispirillia bacterium]MCL2268457.1 flagellar protein FliS [Chitinispirillia bacterium]
MPPPNEPNVARLYENMKVKTTSFKGLICFMHEQTLAYIRKGIEDGSRKDIEKAQNLIFQLELSVTKDRDAASKVLADLYTYCYYLLEKTDPQSIFVANKILETLASAFNQMARPKYRK